MQCKPCCDNRKAAVNCNERIYVLKKNDDKA